jgi:hypothetical protein
MYAAQNHSSEKLYELVANVNPIYLIRLLQHEIGLRNAIIVSVIILFTNAEFNSWQVVLIRFLTALFLACSSM